MQRAASRMIRAVLVWLLAMTLSFSFLPAPRANAAVSYSPWGCAPSGCKYAQARIKIDRVIKYFYTAYWRGGTASQECDPTNNVEKWKLVEIRTTSGMTWSYGPGSWKYHCNVYFVTYGVNVSKYWSGALDVRFEFLHAVPGPDFTSVIYRYG